jgi:hypothetical protein
VDAEPEPLEQQFLHVLAEMAQKRKQLSIPQIKTEIVTRLGIDNQKLNDLLANMEAWGIVNNVRHTVEEKFAYFEVSRKVDLLSERLQTGAQKIKDAIAGIRARLRAWTIVGWIVLSLLTLAFLLALANQVFEFLRNVGLLPAR